MPAVHEIKHIPRTGCQAAILFVLGEVSSALLTRHLSVVSELLSGCFQGLAHMSSAF